MNKLLYKNRYFLVPQLLFLIVGVSLFPFFSKPELHVAFNKLNTSSLDSFFKQITFLGDGLMYLFLLPLLLLRKLRFLAIFATSVVVSNIIVLSSKHLIAANTYRPSAYFELYHNYKLHLVEGVQLHSLHSFPSGHTTTAFTIFALLAFMTKNNTSKLLLFIVALITGYSRIYLSQHFLIDVIVGSVIGTGSIFFAWFYLKKSKRAWMKKSIARRSKKRKGTGSDSEIATQSPEVAL